MSDPTGGRPGLRPARVVLLNGPRFSGKDTAAAAIRDEWRSAHDVKISETLKVVAHELHGMAGTRWDHFEDRKDVPCPEFGGRKPRDVYIEVSEKVIKPHYGEDWLGLQAVKKASALVAREGARLITVSDSGFAREAGPFVERFGAENVLLLRLSRGALDFAGDSRGYIELPGVEAFDVFNDGTVEDYADRLVSAVGAWLYA